MTSDFNSSSSDRDDEEFVPVTGVKKRPGLSLKGRAVGLLSRREYSRAELARKLAPHAESPEDVERLLDALAAEGWQSDERFIQSVVHRKAPIHGSMRISQELKLKGVSDLQIAEVRSQLKDTELERAKAVWQKRFSRTELSLTPSDYARQGRFLAARGFSHDVIRQVLKGLPCDDDF
jgi:regulatory protein